MLFFSFAPGRLKKFPLTSGLRLEQTKLFREQVLPNFINTCINRSAKNGRGCLLWRKASFSSLYWQQIPSQLTLRKYPETNEKLWKFPLLSSQISEWTAQENSHGVQEPPLLETRLLPQKQLSFIPFSQITLAKKLLSTCSQTLCQSYCNDAPNPGLRTCSINCSFLCQRRLLWQLFHPLVQLLLLLSEPGRTCPNFEGIPRGSWTS